jgi:hypothetical protein
MADRAAQVLTALAAEPTFRTIDGLSIRFVKATVEMCTRSCLAPDGDLERDLAVFEQVIRQRSGVSVGQ